jgi:hypothetical protein
MQPCHHHINHTPMYFNCNLIVAAYTIPTVDWPDHHKSNIKKWECICSHKHILIAGDCNFEKILLYFIAKIKIF